MVFGAYTTCTWNDIPLYKSDSSAFIFILINKDSNPIKIKINQIHKAIDCDSSYGPTYGGGTDLYISDSSNENNKSFSNLSHSYKHSQYVYGSTEAKNFLAGTHNFSTDEIEVFQKCLFL